MANTKINIQVVEENRPNLAAFGGLFGKRIFKAAKEQVITDYNQQKEAAEHNNGVFITRNINRYKVLAIDITGITLEKGINPDEYEVVINKDQVDEVGNSIEVRCPIANNKFTKDVTVDSLRDALMKDPTNANNIYFSSGKKLADFLNQENTKEKAKIDELADSLKKMSMMIETTSEKNSAYADAYYRQLDRRDGGTTVNIHVNAAD